MSNWVDVGEGAFFRSRWVFNCFVVPGAANGRPLVVDLGLPSHADAFCQRWSESPVVVATHLHLDHVGGVPTLEARRPTELAVSDRVRDYQAGTTPEGPRSSTVAKILPVLRSQRFSIGALVELARLDPVGYGLRGPLVMPCQTLRYLENGPCAFAEAGR
jgi:glyoxylase-like metal-dependent hydrolase (beta-lactamase superfamily II)